MMEKQAKYCVEKGIPMFAPQNGICWHCKHKIADTKDEHITGCSYCNHSFCE